MAEQSRRASHLTVVAAAAARDAPLPSNPRPLISKRSLTKKPGRTGATLFGGGRSVDEKPSEARGALKLTAPPPNTKKTAATAKKRNKPATDPDDGSAVKQFNSRLEPSIFLDSVYMERRAKALSAMRQRGSA